MAPRPRVMRKVARAAADDGKPLDANRLRFKLLRASTIGTAMPSQPATGRRSATKGDRMFIQVECAGGVGPVPTEVCGSQPERGIACANEVMR